MVNILTHKWFDAFYLLTVNILTHKWLDAFYLLETVNILTHKRLDSFYLLETVNILTHKWLDAFYLLETVNILTNICEAMPFPTSLATCYRLSYFIRLCSVSNKSVCVFCICLP